MASDPRTRDVRWTILLFALCLGFHVWGIGVGWESRNLPGGEFRQAQTALSTYWIMQENDFSLAYPTPVVGKPWSIPMEFPFYQWTVVVTSKLTGWGLTKAGRAVSIACFYLALPAVFLLLRRWQVAVAWRWLVLAVILTCPFYIFYVRAILIETMALMFSLWFWVAFERAVAGRQWVWLVVALVAGLGAGLVKVTTFMLFLLPAGWWAAARLWEARRGVWRVELAWMVAAVAVPFAATLWWLNFADATKALNPLGMEFTSSALKEWNFGTHETRTSAGLWATKAAIVREELTWLPLVIFCGVLALLAGRARWREICACVFCFGSVLVIFPVLYAHHEYYFVANTVFLLLAMGLSLVGLAESGVSRWLVYGATGLVMLGQGWRYTEHYYPSQREISPGGDELSRSLQALTNPADVIVVLGQDWNSMTPYYSRRRALMIRDHVGRDAARVENALEQLAGEKLGALVLVGEPDGAQWLIDRAVARGISPQPLYIWRNARVFVPVARQNELLHALLENNFHEVKIAPGVEFPQENLAGRWVELASVYSWQRQPFDHMRPAPVRFFSSYGPGLDASGEQPMYGAHPVTRLVFSLPAGSHTLRGTLQMPLDAYRLDLMDAEATDGVEVSLYALGPADERRPLASRYFNPRTNREDRGGLRPLEFSFELPESGEIELFIGPGPAGLDVRDWIQLGPLTIE